LGVLVHQDQQDLKDQQVLLDGLALLVTLDLLDQSDSPVQLV